jgi:hypothetical protein
MAKNAVQRMKFNSFLLELADPDFCGSIQGVTSPRITANLSNDAKIADEAALYSAAAINEGFMFADDTMKSEMRGTISDLKREPLKTP